MSRGWYRQQRDVPDREWFKEPNLVQLYVALKSLAYVADGRYEGVIIRRGSCPVTRSELSELTGMKRMTLDRSLKKLLAYGEIIVKASNRFSVITVCDYDSSEVEESLFRATDGTTVGITDGITVGNAHLLTKEGRIYKREKEREGEDFALEAKKRYNKTFEGKLPPLVRLTLPTRLMVDECVRRFGRQSVDIVFEQVLSEPFHLGKNKTGFIANFQFIFEPRNFQQYLERAQLRKRKEEAGEQEDGGETAASGQGDNGRTASGQGSDGHTAGRQAAGKPQAAGSQQEEKPCTGSWIDAYVNDNKWRPEKRQ